MIIDPRRLLPYSKKYIMGIDRAKALCKDYSVLAVFACTGNSVELIERVVECNKIKFELEVEKIMANYDNIKIIEE